MVATRLTNTSTEAVTLPAPFNRIVGGRQSVLYACTAALLVRALPSIEDAFTVQEFPDQIGGDPLPAVLSSTVESVIVYVATNGSDTAGDGSRARPWRSIHHALRNQPGAFISTSTITADSYMEYQVRVLAPYTSPIGTLFSLPAEINMRTFGNVFVQVIAWPADEATFGRTDDQRWSNLVGPLTPTAAVQFSTSRLQYTLPPGTITTDDQYLGEFVRIFNTSGVEVCRGWVVLTVAATQVCVVHTRQTYTALTADRIYICRPTVVLGSASSSFIGGTQANRITLDFSTVRTTDAITAQGTIRITFSNSQLVANGGGGAVSTNGPAAVIDGSSAITSTGHSSAESALRQHPCFVRVGGGFLGAGNLIVSGPFLGNYWPLLDTYNRFQLNTATLRGTVDASGFGNVSVYVSAFSTSANPLLIIPTAVAAGIFVMAQLSSLVMAVGSFMNVDTARCAGDLIRVRSCSKALLAGAIRPAVPATPMAAGIVVNVTGDGTAMVNTAANTIAGAGSVDVKAGANASVSFATLAAGSPPRSTDAVAQATVYASATF